LTIDSPDSIAFDFDDLLVGADAIGAFLYPSLSPSERQRRAYHLLENRRVPGFKMLNKWHARKRKLRECYAEREAGGAQK
jgi:hypothetical protein